MPHKVPQRIPVIRLNITAIGSSATTTLQPNVLKKKPPTHLHIMHTTSQTRLHRLRMPPKHIHDSGPTEARKNRPGILAHTIGNLSIAYELPATVARPPILNGQLGQRKHHARKDVDDNLLVDAALAAREDGIPANQPGYEAVVPPLLASSHVRVSKEQHAGFVDERKEAEVAGVRAGRFEDELDLFAEGSGAEEEDHDEGVWEAHLGAVHDAVADTLEEREDVMVGWVEDDFLECGLSVRGICVSIGDEYSILEGIALFQLYAYLDRFYAPHVLSLCCDDVSSLRF
jgi:hypothetical protein